MVTLLVVVFDGDGVMISLSRIAVAAGDDDGCFVYGG